ncbi:hypothetical protein AX17_004535 [Amanita inopinata Kibby_2008]|nr:hypothetical protein AX17_004535 [Amanita inopinata Kibby_2008]
MAVGTLRYGRITSSEIGDKVEWCHWGCVSLDTLRQLAAADLEQTQGFQDLRNSDRQKIRLAIARGRIDPSDVPDTAKYPGAESSAISSVSISRKRTADETAVSLSQPPAGTSEEVEDAHQEEVRDELYCTMHTNAVGIQYYTGMVGPGEEILLVREPHNRYDRNAIQVKNISHIQVGHLPRKVAAQLAPLLDRRAISVEGVINDGNLSGRSFSLSITLKLYGPADKKDQLEPQLIWATPGGRGFPKRSAQTVSTVTSLVAGSSSQGRDMIMGSPSEDSKKAEELRRILNNLEKVDDEGRRDSLLDTLCSGEDVFNLPLYQNPPSVKTGELLTDLLKHQKQGLQWCMEREYPVLPTKESDKPAQFWQLRKNGSKIYYYNLATKTPQETPPLLGRGAICGDAMGLGKTLTMLALIIATRSDIPPDYSRTTLIVSPLSVLSNWEKQIEDHCAPDALKYIVYYGANRSLTSQELTKYDVVITTYQTVSGEYSEDARNEFPATNKKRKKSGKTLFDVQWKRIILDEGHTIRNSRTKMAKATCALHAQRRWVLSGTPIINSPTDLGSLLSFLQVCRPLDNEDFFKRLLLRPLKYGQTAGVELLRALMSQICIRRTKEMQDSRGNPLISLPPVEMIRVPVTLNEEARRLYDKVELLSQQRFKDYMNQGVNPVVQSNALGMLTRLRQLALHPGLIPQNYIEELKCADESRTVASSMITPEEKMRLQAVLAKAIEDCEECPICFSILNEPRITSCAHMFCLPCISEVISRDSKCPMDRRPISTADLYEPPPPTALTQAPIVTDEKYDTGISQEPSAKIEQLIHLLKLLPFTEKSLVFSQFTSFMDKIAQALEEARIPYVRFDGQMSAKRRQEAIARFMVPVQDTTASRVNRRRSRRTTENQRKLITDDDSGSVTESDLDIDVDFALTNRKGKGVDRGNMNDSIDNLHSSENPRVMLISLKAGALGLNLTVANNVFLMDPWWQEGIESQAVDRVNRIGQRKPVHVYQLIAEDTVESKVLEIQERKKNLIKQAFSGMKSKETQRQQREARLQGKFATFK